MFLFFHGYIDPDGTQELHLYCMGRKGEKNLLLHSAWECYGMLLEIFLVPVYMSCTDILLQHENSMKKCQSILIINEQQGKKVEQELICLYKKEATKNKMTGAISPQRKIHYSFFCITVHQIISMCKT